MANPTILKIVERTFHEIAGFTTQERAGIYFYQIEAFLPEALRELQRQALAGATLARQYLTKEYVLTASGGKYPLSGADDLLVESLPYATVTNTTESPFPFEWVPNPIDLHYPQPGVDFFYYTVENGVIRVRDLTGTLDTMTANLTIRNGVFRPVLDTDPNVTTVPEQLEDVLVAILKTMVLQKRGGGAPAQQAVA